MNKVITLLFPIFALSACSAGLPDNSTSELEYAVDNVILSNLSYSGPSFFKTENLEILDYEKSGSKLEPIYTGIFRAESVLTENTFQYAPANVNGHFEDHNKVTYTTPFLVVSTDDSQGHRSTITGKFRIDSSKIDKNGKPIFDYIITDWSVAENSWSGLPKISFGNEWDGKPYPRANKPFVITMGSEEYMSAYDLRENEINAFKVKRNKTFDLFRGQWETVKPFQNSNGTTIPVRYQYNRQKSTLSAATPECSKIVNDGIGLWLDIDESYVGKTCRPGSMCERGVIGSVGGRFYSLGQPTPSERYRSGRVFLSISDDYKTAYLDWDNFRWICGNRQNNLLYVIPQVSVMSAPIDLNSDKLTFESYEGRYGSNTRKSEEPTITLTLKKIKKSPQD